MNKILEYLYQLGRKNINKLIWLIVHFAILTTLIICISLAILVNQLKMMLWCFLFAYGLILFTVQGTLYFAGWYKGELDKGEKPIHKLLYKLGLK